MFSSDIGRGRFFAYSCLLLLAEGATAILCISMTMGLAAFAASEPGPAREGLALAILVTSVVFVALRSNFASRRSRDARGSKLILWSYIVFSIIFALMQSATFLVYDFAADDSNLGLNMLGLAITALWFAILIAKPAGGSWDPDAFLEKEGFGGPDPQPLRMERRSESAVRSRPAPEPQPSPVLSGTSRSGRQGFGRRGLA